MRFGFVYTTVCLVAASLGGQAAAQGLSDTPLQSTRAESMGGAIPTLADDKDALFENPAGIGGMRWGKQKTPWVKKLYFPWAAASANAASQDLYKEVKNQGAIDDSTVGKAVIDAQAGKRQYARVNTGLGLVFGRTAVVPFYDTQIAATAKGDGTNLIDFHEISTSGVAYGFSASDKAETFTLGYSGYVVTRSVLAGDLLYDDIIDKDLRKEAMKANTTGYSATGHNVGFNWRMGKAGSPTLGIVMRNAGGTKYKVTKGDGEATTAKQDLTTAFSVSPQVGKTGEFNLSLAADRLLDSDVSFVKKGHLGAELLLWGGSGSYARVALRGGVNAAGGSGGLSFNLGLIGADAGINSVDIGVGNAKVVERRAVGQVYVNVADF